MANIINKMGWFLAVGAFACSAGCSSADAFMEAEFVAEQEEALLTFNQQGELSASDVVSSDQFGFRIAASGNAALVGTFNQASGAVYALNYDGSDWIQEAKLTPDSAVAGAGFGLSLAIFRDTAIVGSYLDSVSGKSTGAAYIFVRENGAWVKQAKLHASDGAPFDLFGSSVALWGDTAVVGAFQGNGMTGAAYVFTRSDGLWTEQGKLVADDVSPGANFGISVAVSGSAIVVGADAKSYEADAEGAAYVFRRTGGVWTQEAALRSSDGAESGFFGNVVAIDGDTILAGSYVSDSLGPGSSAGAVYAFSRTADGWFEQAKIVPGDLAAGDGFGVSINLVNDMAVIGAFHDDAHGATSGSAYLFARCGSAWVERAKLSPSTLSSGDEFGRSVALFRGGFLVGAPNDDAAGPNSGSVFTFTSSSVECGGGDTDPRSGADRGLGGGASTFVEAVSEGAADLGEIPQVGEEPSDHNRGAGPQPGDGLPPVGRDEAAPGNEWEALRLTALGGGSGCHVAAVPGGSSWGFVSLAVAGAVGAGLRRSRRRSKPLRGK